MKLQYELSQMQQNALNLMKQEKIWYCVPYDIQQEVEYQRIVKDGYFVVTNQRILILLGDVVTREYELANLQMIRCESQVNSGMIVAEINGIKTFLIRFSMRHIIRFSYVARGADMLAQGVEERVESKEYEKYCDRCGRALPGTSKCPRCDGKMVSFQKFWRLCDGYQWKLLGISCFMIFSSIIGILIPEVQKRFIDGVLRDKTGNMMDVMRFVSTILTLTIVLVGVNVLRNWWCVSLGANISVSLREKLYRKIQILSLSFIQSRKTGELMNRVVNDTSQIRKFMEDVFGRMLSTLFTMILALTYMVIINPKLTLMSTVLILAVLLITKVFWKKIHRIYHVQWVKDDKMYNGLQDVISGMRVVKSFGKEKEESQKFHQLAQDFTVVQRKNEVFWAIFYPILTFLMGVGAYFAIYFGGLDVLHSKMTVGELVQFVAYTGYLYGPLSWMTHLPRGILQMVTSMNRIYDVLDEQPEIIDDKNAKDVEIKGDITFEDMSFGYHSYEPVLEHIDLNVKHGEMIGLVGPSGAGKSTLINMIMRLYDADGGCIKIDGLDIRQIRQECLHSQIGVVLQETFLFSGSILNNIRFSKQSATLEEIIKAAKAANAHDFICKLPDGYNTYVGEHGYNLSGGERQRIAIARAILNNPRLLILDEATSALDTESEFLIQQALDRLTKGRTTFAIAHRLSTLRNADRLVVIDRHKIAEMGTHNELLEKKGIYYGLVKAQLEMAKVE